MIANSSIIVETIVNTLLRVSERVMEVSREHVVTNIWDTDDFPQRATAQEYLGRKLTDINNSRLVAESDGAVTLAFDTGKDCYIEYATITDAVPVIYGVRILACHPDKDLLFITVGRISGRASVNIVEDKWKLALDASGDGVWDMNMQANTITFSEKWHEIFGYDTNEISSVAEWSEKIHPDDIAKAWRRMEDYLSGKAATYLVEVRYKCKDGSYKWILSRGVVIARADDGSPVRFIGTHTDINERKLAEEKYFATVQLLSKLLNSLPGGIMLTDEHRKIVFINEVLCNVYGVSETPLTLTGISDRAFFEKNIDLYKDRPRFVEKLESLVEKKVMRLSNELETTDGRTFSIDYIPLVLDGKSKGDIWKVKDVTDQKNVEKRFAAQRLFYERMLNNISGDIVALDAGYRFLFINPVAIKNPELRQWLIGKTDEQYCQLRNRPMSLAAERKARYDQAVAEKRLVEWEETFDSPLGPRYHIRRIFPVFNEAGTLDMLIGYGLDITDRVLARKELQTSKDTFESAFNHSGIGMALVSPEGKWLDINKMLCDLTGYSREELQQLTFQDITYPDDAAIDVHLIQQMLKREISTYSLEKRYISKQKKIVLVSLTVSLVWNHDGTPKFFISQVMDISKRKEMENELKGKNVQLEATRISLVNKITQLEDLSHIIAHNLRGPAGNIKMLASVLASKKKEILTDEEELFRDAFTEDEAVELIGDSSEALMSSLATLMEVAEIKLNTGIPYNDCDVKLIINEVIAQLHGVIYEKHAEIKLDLEVEHISYPKAYFENILYNFVSNALKYVRPGVPPRITIATSAHTKRVRLSVKDNGLGIDMKRFGNKIFKLNQVFHPGFDSKGIGLFITKTQVESLGGSVSVESEMNVGSEFIVIL